MSGRSRGWGIKLKKRNHKNRENKSREKKGREKKSRGSVFRQLVVSYIVFAVISVVTLYLCMFTLLAFIGGGRLETLTPYNLVDDKGNLRDIRSFTRIGGWIEKLDSGYHVEEVYGEKQDSVRSYTVEDISEYLCTDHVVETDSTARDYQGFLKPVRIKGETVWYLMKISRETLYMVYSYNVGAGGQAAKAVSAALLLFGAVFVVDCLLMSAYLSRKIKQPLLKITEGMEQVRRGTGAVRLDFQAQKEFGEIRDNFNLMIEQLEKEKREKRLAEEKKNRMLLELSHDIKTPVATIKGCANALEEVLVEPGEVQRYYRTIDRKAGRVNTLANEMFLMLKLEDAGYELQAERTDLCEMARQASAEFYEEITGLGLDFRIRIPEKPIFVNIDRKEFARVVENLLGNVVKYNQTGSMAEVEVRQTDGFAELFVRDDGEAVAGDIRPLLFDPFVRGDRARQSEGGTGLGLAIAFKIMEKHGGELAYERTCGENVFRASLPEDCL